ncbi:hypothetical protein OEZ86_010525 [Tetradesmus obliquus]|nr:hypothetical protein OEZ86_010525 [Tetradesmus obliquus]
MYDVTTSSATSLLQTQAAEAAAGCTVYRWLIKNCTPLYVATTLAHSKLAQQSFAPDELVEATALAFAAHSGSTELVQALVEKSTVLAKYPAWRAEQRPASAMRQLELQWELPKQKLQEAFEQLLAGNSSYVALFGSERIWQGDPFLLQLSVDKGGTVYFPNDGQPGIAVAGYVATTGTAAGIRRVAISVGFKTANVSSISSSDPCDAFKSEGMFTSSVGCWSGMGYNLVQLGQVSSWAAAEAKLRGWNLVHSDGCIHLQGQVKSIT